LKLGTEARAAYTPAVLSIHKLTKTLGGRTLFREAEMTINWGERVALVGPNGAGKSTLFRMILDQEDLDEGTIERDEYAITGYLAQEAGDPGDETILEIAMGINPEMVNVLRTMRDFDAEKIEEVFSDGLLNVLAAPEFAHSDKVRRVFSALENRAYLGDLVGSIGGAGHVHVFIGQENPNIEMREVSLVLAPYGQPGRAVGLVGVLGPTRMSYRQAIGTVSFVSGLLGELVDHLYA